MPDNLTGSQQGVHAVETPLRVGRLPMSIRTIVCRHHHIAVSALFDIHMLERG